MITTTDLNIANNSYTKKDFYQVYPEILELVSKITERWDPASSNESDPGVVLLKLLAFIADKNNYNIDKNILECFMPSATQEDSMRKLCDMMGYEMKYFRSATTKLTFMYQGREIADTNTTIVLPKFTCITNEEEDINYVILDEVKIYNSFYQKAVDAIEGTVCDIDAKVTLDTLDDRNRYYLPETQIAENGIFIESNDLNTIEWHKVSNLNTQASKSYVYKFGFDSRKKLPYLQFPSDIAALIGNGLTIKYIRTSGSAGNVKAKTLTKFASLTEIPVIVNGITDTLPLEEDGKTLLVVSNISAATNGQDIETLDDAYNGFKKTVGTFDTLVTCRDYANAIYNMVSSSDKTTPIVSNVIVSDIRDDINKAYKIMTFNEFGVCISNAAGLDSDTSCFDLFIYPFNNITGAYTADAYVKSFKPNTKSWYEINNNLEENKTIAHNIKIVSTLNNTNDIYCIKNYYNLRAKINTTYRVNSFEEEAILSNIYTALYENFNARNVDFGEELVYDKIFDVIKNADSRIKNVTLDDPDISTKIMLGSGEEQNLDFDQNSDTISSLDSIIVKNILAGRVNYLNRVTELKPNYEEAALTGDTSTFYGGKFKEAVLGAATEDTDQQNCITVVDTELKIINANSYTLQDNENINFIAPNYADKYIYPAFVNYFIIFADSNRKFIAEDEAYKLQSDDVLYINYKATDGTVHNKKYEFNKVYDNGVVIENNTAIIIKPNFKLFDSREYGKTHTPPKKTGYLDTWQTSFVTDKGTGMFTLGSSEQIARVDTVIDTINTITPIFWITKTGDLRNNQILEEGEYFFRTNMAKTDLVTYGPGTKITISVGTNNILSKDLITSTIDLDNVANYGIAAFEDNPWYVFKPNVNEKIECQEMQLITLGSADVLQTCRLAEGVVSTSNPINNVYKTIAIDDINTPLATYVFNGKTEKTLPVLPAGDRWQVRSRLNLNIGPTTLLRLEYQDSVDKSISLYHEKAVKDAEGNISYTTKTILKEFKPTSESGPIILRANYLLQEAGNNSIDTKVMTDDGTILNDLKVYAYKEVPASMKKGTSSDEVPFKVFHNYDDNHTEIGEDITEVNLAINNLKDTEYINLIMFYLDSDDAAAKVSMEGGSMWSYRDGYQNFVSEISLEPGVNVIAIKSSGVLKVNKSATTKIIFSDITTIKRNGVTDGYGLNLETLGISTANSQRVTNIMSAIKSKEDASNIKFYYNAPIDNSLIIDNNFNDPLVWYDYNNIANKFVISELDTSRFKSGITLTTSSRVK